MDKRSPIRVFDNDEQMRSALTQELRALGETVVVLSEGESGNSVPGNHVFLELPSDLSLAEPIAAFLTKRTSQFWLMSADYCTSLTVALQEALVNAIKHGNHCDAAKQVRITATLSGNDAIFTVEDEGDGFNVNQLPHPRDPENLYKSSGRGVLLIRSIMDDTHYNGRGNVVTMEMRRASLLKTGQ